MTEFSQDMTAIAAVLLAATSTIKAILMCIKAFKTSVTINIDKNVWWRGLGFEGWLFIFKAVFLLVVIFYGFHHLILLARSQSPLTTGDAAAIVIHTLFVVMGFYPPAGMEPKLPDRTPAP